MEKIILNKQHDDENLDCTDNSGNANTKCSDNADCLDKSNNNSNVESLCNAGTDSCRSDNSGADCSCEFDNSNDCSHSLDNNDDTSPLSDTQLLMRQLETNGDFNTHLSPPDWTGAKSVDADFPYIPKGWVRFKYALINSLVVLPFRRQKAKQVYGTKTVGLHNLQGVKSAIVISNHIAVFDCMALSYALRRRKLKIVGAEFNNRKSFFGETMRAHGMIPLSSKFAVIKKFSAAVRHYLQNDTLVLIYPEEAMWDLYPKPRPFRNGAFYYATKFGVPVVPIFITLRDKKQGKPQGNNEGNRQSKKNSSGKNGSEKHFTINIAPPVYPDPQLSQDENTQMLKNAAYSACVDIYEKTYGKKLTYLCQNGKCPKADCGAYNCPNRQNHD